MEKKKITFKERLIAFREHWKENWKKDCLYGFLCLVLGFLIARCTPVEENTASADTSTYYSFDRVDLIFDDVSNDYYWSLDLSNTYYFSLDIGNSFLGIFPMFTNNFPEGDDNAFTITVYSSYSEFVFDGKTAIFPLIYDNIYLCDWNSVLSYYFVDEMIIYPLDFNEYGGNFYMLSEAGFFPAYDGLTTYNIFNGASVTYNFASSTSGISSTRFTASVNIDVSNNRLTFDTLFSQIPDSIKNFDFIEPAGQNPASFKASDSLKITIPYEGSIDLHSIVIYFYPSYNSYNAVSNDSFVKLPDSSLVSLSVSDYGTISVVDNVSSKGRFLELSFGGFFGYDTSGTIFAAPIISVLDKMYLSYGSAYDLGYAAGVSSILEQVSFSYQSAYNDGFNSAYNTTDILSPNYVAGYNAGLSNANGSWVLSPINAINTIFNLELFVIGDFPFKLSYLVYLSIGGLLVGVLIRFLFHS